jgi:hypothetical protein
VVFLIHTNRGATRQIRDTAARSAHVKFLVDGSYGASPDLGSSSPKGLSLDNMPTVPCLGGTGLSFMLLFNATAQ